MNWILHPISLLHQDFLVPGPFWAWLSTVVMWVGTHSLAWISVEVALSGRTGIHFAILVSLAKFDHLLDMFVLCL